MTGGGAEAALEVERELRAAAETERDRLREAYEALKVQVELAHRRLVIAKAERVDTAQLELKFAATLLSFDGRDVRRYKRLDAGAFGSRSRWSPAMRLV